MLASWNLGPCVTRQKLDPRFLTALVFYNVDSAGQGSGGGIISSFK